MLINTQKELNALYRRFVDVAEVYGTLGKTEATEQLLDEVDGPFLIATNDDYEAAKPRVVIVGQENDGWIGLYREFFRKYTLEQAVEEYARFWLTQPYHSLFFQEITRIREAIFGKDSRPQVLLWLNLFKFNQGMAPKMISSRYKEAVLTWQADMVRDEIRILRPDAVIFLTGPNYDRIITRFYHDAQRREVDGHPDNEIATVVAGGLPELSFRTYHPNYFNRIRKKKPYCYEAIIDRILQVYPRRK